MRSPGDVRKDIRLTFSDISLRPPIYVPIVGPFIQMGYINGTGANTGRAILAIDGALQAGGLAMFIAGAALWGSSSSRPQYARRIQLAPYSAATGSGLVAFGSF